MSDYDGEEYEVEDILDDTEINGQIYYHVRWKGFGPDKDTLEPIENLENCQELLNKYYERKEEENLNKLKSSKSKSKSSPRKQKTVVKKKVVKKTIKESPKKDKHTTKKNVEDIARKNVDDIFSDNVLYSDSDSSTKTEQKKKKNDKNSKNSSKSKDKVSLKSKAKPLSNLQHIIFSDYQDDDEESGNIMADISEDDEVFEIVPINKEKEKKDKGREKEKEKKEKEKKEKEKKEKEKEKEKKEKETKKKKNEKEKEKENSKIDQAKSVKSGKESPKTKKSPSKSSKKSPKKDESSKSDSKKRSSNKKLIEPENKYNLPFDIFLSDDNDQNEDTEINYNIYARYSEEHRLVSNPFPIEAMKCNIDEKSVQQIECQFPNQIKEELIPVSILKILQPKMLENFTSNLENDI